MNIILIKGKATHGKTVLAKFLQIALEHQGHSAKCFAFGNELKDVCKHYFDWDGKKDKDGRSLLQKVGTEIVRSKDEFFWARHLRELLEVLDDSIEVAIIDDWRFITEIEEFEDYLADGRLITIGIDRGKDYVSGLTEEQLSHQSETELEDYVCEYEVENTLSLNDLQASAREIVKDIEWRIK